MSINTCLEHSCSGIIGNDRKSERESKQHPQTAPSASLSSAFCTNSRPFPLNRGCVRGAQKTAYERGNAGTGSKPHGLLREFSHDVLKKLNLGQSLT